MPQERLWSTLQVQRQQQKAEWEGASDKQAAFNKETEDILCLEVLWAHKLPE